MKIKKVNLEIIIQSRKIIGIQDTIIYAFRGGGKPPILNK
jgi:hypothetical protein